jgi:hypothetical protein
MKAYALALNGILDGTLVSVHGLTPFQEQNLAIPMPLTGLKISFNNK